jgi:hypothetical protein
MTMMTPLKSSCALILAGLTALSIAIPAFARGEAGRGTAGAGLGRNGFAGRGGPGARDSGRGPGGTGRSNPGPRSGGRKSEDERPAGGEGRRRGPTDRPDWDGRTPGRNYGRRNHHGPRWWYNRPGFYGGAFGYGAGFYDPFYNPFNAYGSYGSFDRDQEREDDRNIDVRVKPDTAQVYVDGLLYSNSGKARFTLPSGPWVVELRAPGYRTERVELTVEQGKRYKIERTLQRDETFGRDGKPLQGEDLLPRGR